MWLDRRITDLFGIELPIVQAPMAGVQGSELAIAVSEVGCLGSLLVSALLTLVLLGASLFVFRRASAEMVDVL